MVRNLAIIILKRRQLLIREVLQSKKTGHAYVTQNDYRSVHFAKDDSTNDCINRYNNQIWELPRTIDEDIDVFCEDVYQLSFRIFDLLLIVSFGSTNLCPQPEFGYVFKYPALDRCLNISVEVVHVQIIVVSDKNSQQAEKTKGKEEQPVVS